MVRKHRRFELLQASLGDIPIGSCTIDLWEGDDGREQWSARVLMKLGHGSTEGALVGRTRDHHWFTGPARFAADQQGPRGGRTVLVELHGLGPLEPTDAPPVPVEADPAAGSTEPGSGTSSDAAGADPATPTPGADPATPATNAGDRSG